jgi:hypothetical protein
VEHVFLELNVDQASIQEQDFVMAVDYAVYQMQLQALAHLVAVALVQVVMQILVKPLVEVVPKAAAVLPETSLVQDYAMVEDFAAYQIVVRCLLVAL